MMKSSWFSRTYLWLADRLYNEFAWAYDPVSWLVSLGQWDSIRKTALSRITGHRILEIGFGTGELLIALTRQGCQVFGLDLSLAMQSQAEKKLLRAGIPVPRICGRVQYSPFQSEIFDSIISTFPAPFILDPRTWQECARLLRPVSPQGAARFVVVGLWIVPARVLTHKDYVLAVVQQKNIFYELASNAGLKLTVEDVQYRGWSFPILIGEKNH
jgi:ubiquinone/menaquinone biosynthesis C-methylase UbiE